MASGLDLEFIQIMQDIEARAGKAVPFDRGGRAGPAPTRLAGHRVRNLLYLLLLILLIGAALYLAFLAGLFGTIEGENRLWKKVYEGKSKEYDQLWAAYLNRSEHLNMARAEADDWRARADGYSRDLAECTLELERVGRSKQEWESRCWRAEISLNDTLLQVHELEAEASELEKDRDEWMLQYLATKGSLNCLEIRYSELKDDLEQLKQANAKATSDKELLEAELTNRTVEIIRLRCELASARLAVDHLTNERDTWVSRFEELEAAYKDLLCEVKVSRLLVDHWKHLYEEQESKLNEALAQIDALRTRCESLAAALNESDLQNRELRGLYESLMARFASVAQDRDRWRDAYLEMYSKYNSSVEEVEYWRSNYQSMSSVLARIEWERDSWMALYQMVVGQLSECQSEVRYWRSLYLACESELRDAIAQVQYWKALYQGLANISVKLQIGNVSVDARSCGKPSVVSADITVCVSTKDTPIFLFLEYWAEPVDCVYGYGSILEDVSKWPSQCKRFRVTLSFGRGLSSYKIAARASLRPILGYDEVSLVGPT